jgi:hypothetical protein
MIVMIENEVKTIKRMQRRLLESVKQVPPEEDRRTSDVEFIIAQMPLILGGSLLLGALEYLLDVVQRGGIHHSAAFWAVHSFLGELIALPIIVLFIFVEESEGSEGNARLSENANKIKKFADDHEMDPKKNNIGDLIIALLNDTKNGNYTVVQGKNMFSRIIQNLKHSHDPRVQAAINKEKRKIAA